MILLDFYSADYLMEQWRNNCELWWCPLYELQWSSRIMKARIKFGQHYPCIKTNWFNAAYAAYIVNIQTLICTNDNIENKPERIKFMREIITMRLKFMKKSQERAIHYCHYWSYSTAWHKQETSSDLLIRMSQQSQRIFQPKYTGCSSLTLNNSLHISKIQISIMALTLYIPSRQSEFTENINLLGPSVWIHLQQEIRQPLREDIQNDSFPEANKWYQCWKFTTPAYPIVSHPGGQYQYFYKPLRTCTSTTRTRPTDPRKFVVPKLYLLHSLLQRKYLSLWHYARSSIKLPLISCKCGEDISRVSTSTWTWPRFYAIRIWIWQGSWIRS